MDTHASAGNETSPLPEPEKITCSVCRKEIPISAAFTPEGADYVGQFCGIECYEEFVAQNRLSQAGKSGK